MFKKLLNLIFLSFKGYSLLRSYQLNECKNIKLKGYSIEFGAYKDKRKNFNNFFKGNSKFTFSNIYRKKDKNYIKLDLTKKLGLKKNTFDNIIIMNVLEHLPDLSIVFEEINRILKKKGNLIGSTPLFIKFMERHLITIDLRRIFFIKIFQKKNINL